MDCRTIRDAVDRVKAIQVQSLRTGSKLVSRQVSFGADQVPLEVRQASMSPLRCVTCQGTGHRSQDCANRRRRSPSPFRCWECQGQGHVAFECANRLHRRNRSPSANRTRLDMSEDFKEKRGREVERRPSYMYDHGGRYSSGERASPTRDDHQENRGDDYKYRKQDYNYSPKQGTSANRMDQPTPRGKSQEAYRDFSRGPSPKSPERSYRDASKSRLSGNGQLSNSSSSSLNYQQ